MWNIHIEWNNQWKLSQNKDKETKTKILPREELILVNEALQQKSKQKRKEYEDLREANSTNKITNANICVAHGLWKGLWQDNA